MNSSTEWNGATFIVLGDSIMAQGCLALDTVRDQLGFASYVNRAENGQTMADGDADGAESGTVTVALGQAYGNYSLAYIAAGTNDFKRGLPLGRLGRIGDTDLDRTTYLGAYRTAIEHILGENPGIRLVLATPLQRDKDGVDVDTVNSDGRTLGDYAQAVRDVGRMYSVPVCDMYADSGLTALTLPYFTDDGLHPNEVGYVRVANRIVAFLRTIGA